MNPSTRFRVRTALATLVIVPSMCIANVAHAQRRSARALTNRIQVGGHLQVSEPRGDFAQNTDNGVGVDGIALIRVDPNGLLNVRTDLGFITYGTSTRRIDFANTGGLVKLDLKTSSNIFSMVIGPQIGGTVGPFAPYLAALGGFSVFWTESSVEGSRNTDEPFASTTNSSDAVLAYGGAAGATIRVYNGDRPVRVDLGARYLRHDDVRYLNQARVEEAFRNSRDPIPLRGRADFVAYYLGATVVVF